MTLKTNAKNADGKAQATVDHRNGDLYIEAGQVIVLIPRQDLEGLYAESTKAHDALSKRLNDMLPGNWQRM